MEILNNDRTPKNLEKFCPSCLNGKVFEGIEVHKESEIDDDFADFGCVPCNTVFRVKKSKAKLSLPFIAKNKTGPSMQMEKIKRRAKLKTNFF